MTNGPRFQIFKIPAWQIWIASAFALALGVALAILTAGLFILLAPVALLTWLYYRFIYRARTPKKGDAEIIEAEYTVLEPEEKPKGGPAKKLLKR